MRFFNQITFQKNIAKSSMLRIILLHNHGLFLPLLFLKILSCNTSFIIIPGLCFIFSRFQRAWLPWPKIHEWAFCTPLSDKHTLLELDFTDQWIILHFGQLNTKPEKHNLINLAVIDVKEYEKRHDLHGDLEGSSSRVSHSIPLFDTSLKCKTS